MPRRNSCGVDYLSHPSVPRHFAVEWYSTMLFDGVKWLNAYTWSVFAQPTLFKENGNLVFLHRIVYLRGLPSLWTTNIQRLWLYGSPFVDRNRIVFSRRGRTFNRIVAIVCSHHGLIVGACVW